MKSTATLLLAGLLLAASGCSRKHPITPLQRKEAANLASEAQFAATMEEYPRAERLLRKVTALCPDNGDYWFDLGTVCRKNGEKSKAKDSYEHAVRAYADAYKARPDDPRPLLQQAFVDALLGRTTEARDALKLARKEHGSNPQVRNFNDQTFDRMLSSPSFKALAL